MTYIIDSLQRDHRNIEQLLKVLEQELDVFDKSERPDYEVIQAVVKYFKAYPDLFHHPKEELVFNKLKEVNPEAAAQVGDLEGEHVEESKYLNQFADTVQDILANLEVPRDVFRQAARGFIDNERQHMRMEEEQFFPVAKRVLSDKDWDELNIKLVSSTDPLFDKGTKEKFGRLYERILRWENENQQERTFESVD